MTAPVLPGLYDEPPVTKRHRPVRETSRTAYQVGMDKFTGRKFNVLCWLEQWFAGHDIAPTSAELARWAQPLMKDRTSDLLYVRRGLSDLSACGAVENPKGVDGKLLKRPCAVTGSNCYVWRVRQR